MLSVVLRTKNESQWIGRCLSALSAQNYPAVEIIVVDNQSVDGTLDIIGRYDCKVLSISDKDFTFGRSLNLGIRESSGEYVAILSGHCIPVDDQWLSMLRAGFLDESVAGVYGRQLPLPDTSPYDKRDLWTTFGIEQRVQHQDFFFHNANSIIRRAVWEEIPFDEEIAGVEDREWAKEVIRCGYQIVYQPLASVFHYHGIHHGRNEERSTRVAKVIELIQQRGRSHA